MFSRFSRSLPSFLHCLKSRPSKPPFSTPTEPFRAMSTNLDAARAHVIDQVKVDLLALTQEEVGCSSTRNASLDNTPHAG